MSCAGLLGVVHDCLLFCCVHVSLCVFSCLGLCVDVCVYDSMCRCRVLLVVSVLLPLRFLCVVFLVCFLCDLCA